LREWCDGLAGDLAVNSGSVSVRAWAAGKATRVAMHYDHDFNQPAARRPQALAYRAKRSDHQSGPELSTATNGVATDSGRAMPTEMPEDTQTWTAEPGDLVWLPQGTWHATRTEEPSVAMAFVVQPPA
jgi:hypothetical protein